MTSIYSIAFSVRRKFTDQVYYLIEILNFVLMDLIILVLKYYGFYSLILSLSDKT